MISNNNYDDSTIKKIVEFLNDFPGYGKTSKQALAEKLGVSPEAISQAKKSIRQQNTPAITEYEKFTTTHGIDQNDVATVWYKGKDFSVRTKVSQVEFDQEKFEQSIKGYKIPELPPKGFDKIKDTNFAVINMFDAHVDKLSFTGDGGKKEMFGNLDTLWEQFLKLLSEISLYYRPHTIVFPIGNDFFTTNGREQATRAGTPQHRTTHWQDSFEAGIEFYRRCIDAIRATTPNCHIVNIPGNHDHDLVLALGSVINALYKDTEGVSLGISKNARKYVTIGDCLLGFAHGKTEYRRVKDLPTAMAIENSYFSTAKYRAFYLGDKHHKEEYKSLTKLEHNGVDIKFLRSCTNEDEWHNEQLWIGARKSVSAEVIKNDGSSLRSLENFF